jgi:predicted metal-dependent HD superfamily phosphohydrolase
MRGKKALTRDRWRSLTVRLSLPASDGAFSALLNVYSEPHRHYHTAAHVDTCLGHLDSVRNLVPEPDEAELALWFHDAVYRIGSRTNEEESASWARKFCLEAGLPSARADRICGLVMSTGHDAAPEDETARWVVDIDLAILGALSDVYEEYRRALRREYALVPDSRYAQERRKVLEGFLARPAIYLTGHFHRMLENRARNNMRREYGRLEAGQALSPGGHAG